MTNFNDGFSKDPADSCSEITLSSPAFHCKSVDDLGCLFYGTRHHIGLVGVMVSVSVAYLTYHAIAPFPLIF